MNPFGILIIVHVTINLFCSARKNLPQSAALLPLLIISGGLAFSFADHASDTVSRMGYRVFSAPEGKYYDLPAGKSEFTSLPVIVETKEDPVNTGKINWGGAYCTKDLGARFYSVSNNDNLMPVCRSLANELTSSKR